MFPIRPHSTLVMMLLLVLPAPLHAQSDGSGSSSFRPRELTAARALRDVRLLRQALETVHPGLDRYTGRAALDAAFEELENLAAGGMTAGELHVETSRLLALVRCGHTKAEVPEWLAEHRRRHPSHLPFTFRILENRMIVDRVPAGSPLRRGAEVLTINDRAVADVFEAVRPLLSVDGWTDASKRVELAASLELQGGGVDHFWPLLHGWPDVWRIEARSAAAAEVSRHTVAPITHDAWLELLTAGADDRDFKDAVTLSRPDDRTAVMRIGTFVNYRKPVDPMQKLAPLVRSLVNDGVEHLIFDLRDCGGGSTDVPGALMRLLADRPVVAARRRPCVKAVRFGALRPHLSTWDAGVFRIPMEAFRERADGYWEMGPALAPDALAPVEPAAEGYRGKLTVLIGPANASGATNFVAVLREHRAGMRTVGEATGGSADGTTAGLIFFLTLPESGIKVRLPAIRSYNNVTRFRPGYGIEPDLEVPVRVRDFRAGRDVALETARRTPFPEPLGGEGTARARLHDLFTGLSERGRFHGNVLVAEKGRIVYEGSFGLADDIERLPNRPATRFAIASVSKCFTALAVLLLKDDGKLDLDDPAVRHLPRFPYRKVTIRHLLTHTSGIPSHLEVFRGNADRGSVATNASVMAMLRDRKIAATSEPGARFVYNNINYVALAEIVARVSGMPFSEFQRTRIFAPLGMTSTRVYATRWTTGERVEDLARPYVRGESGAWVAPESTDDFAFVRFLGGTEGDGALITTARDLLLWDAALAKGTLVKPATWKEATRPLVLADGTEHWERSWTENSYGLGWRLGRDGTMWHTGDWGGYLAAVKRHPATGRVYVYMMNRRSTDWSWLGQLEAIMASPDPLLPEK